MRREPQEDKHKINEAILCEKVRLVGDNVESGIYTTSQALSIARGLEMDLVQITDKADLPVCKAMNYKKFLFEEKKKQKKSKGKRH